MADNGESKKGVAKWTYIAAIVAGGIIFVNGMFQLNVGNAPLAYASLGIGAAAVAFGILKPGKKK